MEEKVTLDREAFRTLASKTRVDILKSLDKRRKMLAELSKEFGMSPSTIKEHMDNLSRAGLVVQIDDGHKWKYYELTKKGKEIVNPTGSRIFIVLGLAVVAILITSLDMFRAFSMQSASFAVEKAMPEAVLRGNEAFADNSGFGAAEAISSLPATTTTVIPTMHIIGLAVFAAILGISIGWLLAKRTQPNTL